MSAWDTPRGRLTRIGEYDLGDTIGRGAYAHVRRAVHRDTGHEVACKILPALHVPGVPVTWDKVLDATEAYKEIVLLKALAGAGIPGIVQLEGMMEEEGWTYVFMKLYDGELRRDNCPKGDAEVIPFFRALLRTVEALHCLGVTHEDIKRANVLLLKTHDRVLPILGDFGFAQFVPDGGLVHSLGGTVDYSSPEKVKNQMYDPFASEVWSLGILLCKLLHIPHPYILDDKWTSERLRKNLLDGRPKWRFRDKRDTRRGGVAEVIMGMLHRNPDERWKIGDVLEHDFMYEYESSPSRSIRISPRPRLDWDVERPVSRTVLLDICFLAQQHGEFYLCQNPEIMEEAIYDRFPHWQQRWATMLTKWEKQREVKEWIDLIPPTIDERKTKSAPSRLPRRVQGLREIHMTPVQIPKKLPRPVVARSPLSPKIRMPDRGTKVNIENEAPQSPKVITVSRGIGAAVGVAVPRIIGRGGFGRTRGREIEVYTPAQSGSEEVDETPTKPPPPKVARPKVGKPVKTLPLAAKKTVPAPKTTRRLRSTSAEQKLKDLQINTTNRRKRDTLEKRE